MPQTCCIELWKLKMLKKTWLYTQNCQDSCQQHSDTSHHPWQNGWHLEVWLALAVPVELCETVEGNQAVPRPQLPHSLLSKKLPMKIYIFQANVETMTKARMCYKPVFQNKFIYIASLQSASAQLWVPIIACSNHQYCTVIETKHIYHVLSLWWQCLTLSYLMFWHGEQKSDVKNYK